MILRWTDREYGQHYLQIGEEVTLLGNYGHDELRPNYGKLYERATAVFPDPPGTDGVTPPIKGELRGEFGDVTSGDQEPLVGSGKGSTIACLFAPGYGGPDDGLLQISCLCLFVLNERGDTIDTLVRERR